MDKKNVEVMLAKAVLLGLNEGEILFLEYELGFSGGFYSGLFNLYWHADFENKRKLESVFPDELGAARKYQSKSGYWEDLLRRAGVE